MMALWVEQDLLKRFLGRSLVLHVGVGLALLIPKGFDLLIWLGLKDPSVNLLISHSMKIEVLDLPDLESYLARPKSQALPKTLTQKAQLKTKSKDKTADKDALKASSRKDIIEQMRKRAGNRLQEGEDILSPAVSVSPGAFEGDPFWSTLEQNIQKHWQIPPHLKQEGLSVTLNVKVASTGSIMSVTLVQSSMHPEYDAFVSNLVTQQWVLDVEIPYRFQGLLEQEGVNIIFSP